jgi:peptidoglycan/xylan/chitin deacetylase (PgdA/CDA1 family)
VTSPHRFALTLTFDNGPEPDATPQVLDVLARRKVRSTFFVIGKSLALPGRRALSERAAAEGHWIGNHTYTHSGPLGLRDGGTVAEDEIGRTQSEIGALSHPHRLFRPQGGGGKLGPHLLSPSAAALLARDRFTCVLWNAIPHDWDDPDGWTDRALLQCREHHWTLMVLHDLPTGAMRHLDRFLGSVSDAGGALRQDFPPDCVPMRDGIATAAFADYVAG